MNRQAPTTQRTLPSTSKPELHARAPAPSGIEILSFIKTREEGATTKELRGAFPDKSIAEIAADLNALSSSGKIDIYRAGDVIFYRENRETHQFASKEEKLIYSLIKDAGEEGVWIKDIKGQSSLHQNLITKVLRNMEQRMMVKSVKSTKQNNRKVYMLYDVRPADSLADGPWFTQDALLDTAFVSALQQVVLSLLASRRDAAGSDGVRRLPLISSLPTAAEILSLIVRSGVSSVPVALSDIETLLNTLVFDGKIARVVSSEPAHGRETRYLFLDTRQS